MRTKLNFYLKDKHSAQTIIFASLHYRGKRYRIFTGEKIESQYWIKETRKIRKTRKKLEKELKSKIRHFLGARFHYLFKVV